MLCMMQGGQLNVHLSRISKYRLSTGIFGMRSIWLTAAARLQCNPSSWASWGAVESSTSGRPFYGPIGCGRKPAAGFLWHRDYITRLSEADDRS